MVRKWPELKSIQDIQVFLGFANSYWQFIQDFNRIAALLTSILKTIRSPDELAPSRINSRRSTSWRNNGNSEVDEFGDNGIKHAKKSEKSKDQKTSKSQKSAKSRKLSMLGKSKGEKPKKPSKSGNSPNFGATESGPSFLIPKARLAFNCLWLAFTEAPILWHFDLKCHIQIETDVSGYAISGVLSQWASRTSSDGVVTKTDLGQWHPIAFFSRKMILAKTRYKTYDDELLAIVKAFKTWRYYLKGCKYEVLVLTDYNNLHCFMDIKSLSSRQVRWAQKLSWYHFQIDYRQGKANATANASSQFLQRVKMMKMSSKLRMAESFTVYRIHWPMLA